MVGVPRSQGCTACRQQKKKCTLDSPGPPCPRCKRLNINCIGFGERRLKFQDETSRFVVKHAGDRNSRSTFCTPPAALVVRKTSKYLLTTATLPKSPVPSQSDNLSLALLHMIRDPNIDSCFDVAFTFGNYLLDVPRYVGSNPCVSAASDALVSSYQEFRRKGRVGHASVEVLRKHCLALEQLRNALTTVEKACEPSTLCAIMVLMVVETLMGMPALQHAGGAAQILKCRGIKPPRNELEEKMLMALRGSVVIQAFSLNENYYTEPEWTALVSGFQSATSIDKEKLFYGLATAARLFQKTRALLSRASATTPWQEETDALFLAASSLRIDLSTQASILLSKLQEARAHWAQAVDDMQFKLQHASCARDYGFMLATQIVLNCTLAALQTVGHHESLDVDKVENSRLARKICDLAEYEAIHHRPLGSCWIHTALLLAYVGASGFAQEEARVRRLLDGYVQEFAGDKAGITVAQMEMLGIFLTCQDIVESGHPIADL